MREASRDPADPEPEDDLLERRDMAGLEPVLDELRDLVRPDRARGDVLPHFARRFRRVAGPIRAVEFRQWVIRDVDEHYIHARCCTVARR